jgi:hypothetical protein
MARPRKSAKELELNGAFRKNPKRRRADPVSRGPLGDPPAHLSDDQRQIWNEFLSTYPEGTLNSENRVWVEIACVLTDKFRKAGKDGRPQMLASEITALQRALHEMGGSPTSKAKLGRPAKEKNKEADNPFSEFLESPHKETGNDGGTVQ